MAKTVRNGRKVLRARTLISKSEVTLYRDTYSQNSCELIVFNSASSGTYSTMLAEKAVRHYADCTESLRKSFYSFL